MTHQNTAAPFPLDWEGQAHGGRTLAVLGQVGKLDAVVREHGVDLVETAATNSSRKALAAMPVARLTSWAKAYFEVRSTATKRCSLPSSVRTSAMSMWKKPIG